MVEENIGNKLRQPIVTVVGHVDHGKTSILDKFRESSIQEGEAGGITQKISCTKFPVEQINNACPLIKKSGVGLEIPGFLFIDTPGHAAFTNLRKRGGSLADLAILVVNIKEGIKPQTAEVLQILKAHKTPFLIALNKVDTISGWQRKSNLNESINGQAINVSNEFQQALLTFQGSLQQHGFDSDLYYEVSDFTKKIALVPCSAKTGEGISELLFVLCGLCQKYLRERLKIGGVAKGVILEVSKGKGVSQTEAILYDGVLKEGDQIVIAALDGEPITSKVRGIQEMEPLVCRYKSVKKVGAASGVSLNLTNNEGVLSGMPFQQIRNEDDLKEVKESFKKSISQAVNVSKQGIIAKADSLGSLEALLTLLKEANVSVVKAGIGPIGKSDLISAKANLEINPLDAAVVGFNVSLEDDVDVGNVKVFSDEVVYKLIDDISEWRNIRHAEIEREKLMGLASLFKLEILPQYVFRNSNPAIFGVRIVAGKGKADTQVFDENGLEIGKIKNFQEDKSSVSEVSQGKEVAMSIPGIAFDRKLKDSRYLYSNISERQFRDFKKHKNLISGDEISVLQEIADIKRKQKEDWGM